MKAMEQNNDEEIQGNDEMVNRWGRVKGWEEGGGQGSFLNSHDERVSAKGVGGNNLETRRTSPAKGKKNMTGQLQLELSSVGSRPREVWRGRRARNKAPFAVGKTWAVLVQATTPPCASTPVTDYSNSGCEPKPQLGVYLVIQDPLHEPTAAKRVPCVSLVCPAADHM